MRTRRKHKPVITSCGCDICPGCAIHDGWALPFEHCCDYCPHLFRKPTPTTTEV